MPDTLPPDEWTLDVLDLEAYLARVGYTGPLEPNLSTLTALHRAHIGAIRFGNLDVILGREISVDLKDIQAKLVTHEREGYCYEHGILFGAVLARLGFPLRRLLARTGDPAEGLRPRGHLTLRVEVDGEPWLADVGFGSGLLTPIPLAATGPTAHGAWSYQLVPGAESGWYLQESGAEGWKTVQSFTEEPQHLVDIETANFNTSHNPRSPFVQRPVLVRKDETSVRRLIGREYTVDRPGEPAESRLLTDAEFAQSVEETFGLRLSSTEIASVVATLPAD